MLNIRNFCIIAHIDHGKSTLADRMLDITGTIEKRKMREQFLDSMELERERGITIKMKPVRMNYLFSDEPYILNLIDTPGHIDFSYEVSRALKAVEGAILLVDATQGIQAQTLTTLEMAIGEGLTIIPVVTKIDSPIAKTEETAKEIMELTGCVREEILLVSGKTGEGVPDLLERIVDKIPPPKEQAGETSARALIFDFQYSNHKGVILFIRAMNGSITKADGMMFCSNKQVFKPLEVGIFVPDEKPTEVLSPGEIGYIVTGIKEPNVAFVGDTVTLAKKPALPLPGYAIPKPVVFASFYPESQDDFDLLRQSLSKLKLSDSAFQFEEESRGILGRGFRCGFLGMLHLEIIAERLKREFSLELVLTSPSVTYEILKKDGEKMTAYSAVQFPNYGDIVKVFEPIALIKIITPQDYISNLVKLLYDHEAVIGETHTQANGKARIEARMPLRELMRDFFDEVKSATSGFASLSYKISDLEEADVVRLDVLVADEVFPAFSRIVSRSKVETEAEKTAEKLYGILPKQMFEMKIQASALGRILASRRVSAMKKDVTGYLYGGDISRKKKLWAKQKKGKKKMKERGTVNISHDVFIKMLRRES